MKKYITLLFLILSIVVFSQTAPQLINYQGVARTVTGVSITGTISVKFDLHQGSLMGSVVFSETQNVTTNQFGVFSVQIGKNNSNDFATINWANGPYFLEVSMDQAGGTNFQSISNQQLVSVPYALYAEKAKNASETKITASSNVSITSSGTNTFDLVVPNYVAGANVTISPVGGNTFEINAGSASTASSNIWVKNLDSVMLVNKLNLVGIGNINSTAKLSVNTIGSLSLDGINAASLGGNGINVNTSSSAVAHAAVRAFNSGAGDGVVGQAVSSNTASSGVKGIASSNGIGVKGEAAGIGQGVFGENTFGTSSPSAHGVKGKTINSSAVAAGVIGENYGNGPGIYGYQGNSGAGSNGSGVFGVGNSASAAGVQGIHNNGHSGVYGISTQPLSSANGNGVWGETYATSASAAGVKGRNYAINAGPGVMGLTNSTVSPGVYGENYGEGNGIFGRANSNNASITTAGVQGNHYGSGYGVYGISISSASGYSGVYGKSTGGGNGVFGETASIFTNAAGVSAVNFGAGPAIKATLPTGTVSGGTNLAVLLENGHIKSSQATAPTVSTFTATGGIASVSYSTSNCTDVKGSLLAVCTTTGMINIGGTAVIRVLFNKPYTIAPTVVITPANDFRGMTYFISNVTPTFFNVTLKNNTAANILGSTIDFNFNYIVIE